MKEDVARAGAGEVANARDRSVAGVRAQIDTASPIATYDLPLVNGASCRVLPENVVCARAGKIADANDLVAGRMSAWTDACQPLAVRPEFQMSVATVPLLFTLVQSTPSLPESKKASVPEI
jgi:hypothetical protein